MKKEHILLTSVCALGAIAAVSISLFVWKSVTSGGSTPPAPVEEYCLVNFDSNGGSHVDAQKVKKGEKAVKPDNPFHEPVIEYTFGGWFTDDGKDYDFNKVVTNDITLHAKWDIDPQPNKHIVRFEAGGGTIEGQDFITVTEGSTISKAPTVNRPGYDASQVTWWTEVTEGEQFIFGDEGTKVEHDYFLHARWGDIKTYTVYFKDADDESEIYEEQVIEYNHLVQRPVNPTKEGYTFYTWYNQDKTTEFDFGVPLTGEDTEITIYAKWNEIEPVISESIIMTVNIDELDSVSFECITYGQHKVNWGDGTEEIVSSTNTHTYYVTGHYNISIYGEGPLDSLKLLDESKTYLTGVMTQDIVTIPKEAFSDCTALKCVSISNNVKTIGESAFSGCSNLESVTFDEPYSSLESIGQYAFQNCPDKIFKTYENCKYLPSTRNPHFALIECKSDRLTSTSVYIDHLCVIIADYAFNLYQSLDTVIFNHEGDSELKVIGASAFRDCDALSSITIPSSVILIGSYAFYSCSILENIEFDENLETIADYAFDSCSKLETVDFGENSKLKNIGNMAFESCYSLSSITIPSSVASIGLNPFAACSSLTSVKVDEENEVYEDRDSNAIIEKATNILITGCCNTTIPDGITSIGDVAFAVCLSLSSITIPNSVTSIGMGAFGACAFSSITIPSGVSSIGMAAFGSCAALQNVTFEEGSKLESIDKNVFDSCESLSSIIIPANVTLIDEGAFQDCSSLTFITIPNSVTSIGISAFEDCSDLTYVTIPNSVTFIGEDAFRNCSKLETFTFEEESKLEAISESMFKGCSSLTSIIIPISVTSIGISAFEDCSDLAYVTVPSGVTSIGEDAFRNCSQLQTVDLTALDNPPTLGGHAFEGYPDSLKLYVKTNMLEAFKAADGWKDYKDIITDEPVPSIN